MPPGKGADMPFVEWEEKYLLGIDQFDVHHKHLVDLLNEVYELFLLKNEDDGNLIRILDSLADYVKYHFDLEESWMRQVDYPRQEEHVLEHKRFVFKLYEFNRQYQEDKVTLTLEIVSFLRRWLLDHILNADAKYGAFIRRKPLPL
jgi:hemerythrin